MSATYNINWNTEYNKGGIPSSTRRTPSAAVTWGLENLPFLIDRPFSALHVLDVGCGAGRNALFMADQGLTVTGFDASTIAIERAKTQAGGDSPTFLAHDLANGLPAKDGSIDLMTDIFVYKHQLDTAARRAYRREIWRVLKADGCLLLSLADKTDGYYSQCPDFPHRVGETPRIILDTPVNIGSVLYDPQELQDELSDSFSLAMLWKKDSVSPMHGQDYPRTVLTSLWLRHPNS